MGFATVDSMAAGYRKLVRSPNIESGLGCGGRSMSRFNRLIVVSHTDRGTRVRIISARRMTRREREIYENG